MRRRETAGRCKRCTTTTAAWRPVSDVAPVYNHNHHHHPKTQRHRGGNRACHLFERHGVATGETMIGMRTSRIHSRPYSAGSPASSRASFKVYSTVRVSRACYTILYYQVRCTAVYLCLPPFSSFFFFLFFPIYHIRPYFLSSSY